MGRTSGIGNAPGAKPDRNDLLFGIVCMVLGILAICLSWFAFRGGGVVPQANIRAENNANAGHGGTMSDSVYRDGSHESTSETTRTLTTSPGKAFPGL